MSNCLIEKEVLDGEPMKAFLNRVDLAVSLSDPPTDEYPLLKP